MAKESQPHYYHQVKIVPLSTLEDDKFCAEFCETGGIIAQRYKVVAMGSSSFDGHNNGAQNRFYLFEDGRNANGFIKSVTECPMAKTVSCQSFESLKQPLDLLENRQT